MTLLESPYAAAAATLSSISFLEHISLLLFGCPRRSAMNLKGLLKKAFLCRCFSLCFFLGCLCPSLSKFFRSSELSSFRASFPSWSAFHHLFLSVLSSFRSSAIWRCLLQGSAGGLTALPSYTPKVSCNA